MIISLIDKNSIKQIQDVERIFFDTSSVKNFTSNQKKKEFKDKYLGYYLETYPDYFYVAIENNKVIGYVCACPDTNADPYFLNALPYYSNLSSLKLNQYPAHLHINLSPDTQGKGIGSSLLAALVSSLSTRGVIGIHIFTVEYSQNVSFYKKNLFCDELSVQYNKTTLHFMGKVINSL